MGRLVPLPGIAFSLGRTSSPDEAIDEEEEEVLSSSEDAELLLPLDES